MSHPPPADAPDTNLPAHREGRKATWFELFFDLVFVVAVAQLSGAFAHHYDWSGAAVFVPGFLALWWCWLGHTFFSTRFDQDRPDQRALGLLQILAVAWLGYGASDPLGERAWVFASGMALFKTLLAIAYLGSWRWRAARGLIRAYALIYAIQAVLWSASVLVSDDARWGLWLAALLLDMASPWWVARHTHQVPPHPEHLPERFGLFTIILLGEAMASVVHALDHGPALTADALVAALGGAVLAFMTWIGYFDLARASGERHVADARGGRSLRLWAYAHVALYLGIAGLAAGTVYLAGQGALQATSRDLLAIGLGLLMLGLALLGLSAGGGEGIARRLCRLAVGLALAVPLFATIAQPSEPAVLLGAAALMLGIQLAVLRAAGRAARS